MQPDRARTKVHWGQDLPGNSFGDVESSLAYCIASARVLSLMQGEKVGLRISRSSVGVNCHGSNLMAWQGSCHESGVQQSLSVTGSLLKRQTFLLLFGGGKCELIGAESKKTSQGMF